MSGDLIIEVDYNGRTVEGRVANNLNGPNVERVKYFLVDYYGELMATVEDLDVRPISSELAKGGRAGLNPVARSAFRLPQIPALEFRTRSGRDAHAGRYRRSRYTEGMSDTGILPFVSLS